MILNRPELIALIRRALELPDDSAIVPAGDGSDHWAFAVNDAFIARVRKHSDDRTADAIKREAALMGILSRISPIPVPEVVAVEPQSGVIVLRRLPGTSLLEKPLSDPLLFAEPLAEFVACIHGISWTTVEHLVQRDEYPLDAYLSEAAGQMEHLASHLTRAQRHCVERFLSGPVPAQPQYRTFCHNDLGAEHVLASEDRSELTGIIDWSDAAIADPARDLGRLLGGFGFGVAEVVLRRMGGDEGTLMRATFYARCALLEDLAYGIHASRREYVAHALARFGEIFS